MYLSVTGLRLKKGLWKTLLFWRNAILSKMQADRAPGVLHVQVIEVEGVQHTYTVWESRAAMMSYRNSGAHRRAKKVFRQIATGRTYGWESDRQLAWEEALQMWREKSVEY